MLRKIALVVVVLLALLLGFAATRPATFRVERTASIKAPPERIFPFISDFHMWNAWSPYEQLDPAMKRTYSGPPSGPGAVYEWEGNKKVGKGRMEIRKSVPVSNLVITLDFIEPWSAHNTAEFTLAPAAGATDITWAMYGPNLFMTKLMGIFMSFDKMIGKDFERGLENLKQAAEG